MLHVKICFTNHINLPPILAFGLNVGVSGSYCIGYRFCYTSSLTLYHRITDSLINHYQQPLTVFFWYPITTVILQSEQLNFQVLQNSSCSKRPHQVPLKREVMSGENSTQAWRQRLFHYWRNNCTENYWGSMWQFSIINNQHLGELLGQNEYWLYDNHGNRWIV